MSYIEWLKQSKWGIILHYMPGTPGSGADGWNVSADEWNRQVDSFGTRKLAELLADVGVGYLMSKLAACSTHEFANNIIGLVDWEGEKQPLLPKKVVVFAPLVFVTRQYPSMP